MTPFGPIRTTAKLDLNNDSAYANFQSASTDGLGWINCGGYKKATFQVVPDSAATTAVCKVRYSLNQKDGVDFDSGATITLSSSTAVTVDVDGIPYIRLDVTTAEGAALEGAVWVYLENSDIA